MNLDAVQPLAIAAALDGAAGLRSYLVITKSSHMARAACTGD